MERWLRYTLAIPVGIVGWMVAVWLADALFGTIYSAHPLFVWKHMTVGLLAGVVSTAAAPRGAWWFGPVPVAVFYLVLELAARVMWDGPGPWTTFAAAAMGGVIGSCLRSDGGEKSA